MEPSNINKNRFFEAFQHRLRPETILRESYYADEGTKLEELLAAHSPKEISASDLKNVVEGKLWMLGADAYLYFLPAFLNASLHSYRHISVFVSELLGSLTQPSRSDVSDAFDLLGKNLTDLGLPDDMTDLAKEQQMEWFDSGTPESIFYARFEKLTHDEGSAVLSFLTDLKTKHGEDFPFDEINTAIERFWKKFQK